MAVIFSQKWMYDMEGMCVHLNNSGIATVSVVRVIACDRALEIERVDRVCSGN